MKQNVTLRDIAREMGISHVSVSLALRDNPRISEATRDRVKQKAVEMGYRRDPMLSALSHYRKMCNDQSRQDVIAWVNPRAGPLTESPSEEYTLCWKGACEVAQQLGYSFNEFSAGEVPVLDMCELFKRRNIQGILVGPTDPMVDSTVWNQFPWKDFSAVHLGGCATGPSIDHVASSVVGNAMVAVQQMLLKGYKRIGYIGTGADKRLSVAGYLSGVLEVPEPQQLSPLLADSGKDALTFDILYRWMKEQQPDAILTDLAELPSMLESLGYSVPGDVGLAALRVCDTSIDAGIDHHPEEIGRTGARALVSLLNEFHFGIPVAGSSISVNGSWVDGAMLPRRA